MPEDKRVYCADIFGNASDRVVQCIVQHGERSLQSICKGTGLQRKEAAECIAVLIHFGIVTYTETASGVRYSADEKIHKLVDSVLYVLYAEKVCGDAGRRIAVEIVAKREITIKQGANMCIDMDSAAKALQACGMIKRQKHKTDAKRIKTEEEEWHYTVDKDEMKHIVLCRMMEEDIAKKYTHATEIVYRAIRSAYPMAVAHSTLTHALYAHGVQDTSVLGQSTVEDAAYEHIKYIKGYGVVREIGTQYQADSTEHIKKMQIESIQEYCEKYVQEHAGTVIGMLIARKYTEDKFVQKHTLLSSAECKKALFALLEEGLVGMQMVPRTAECISAKSFHLWHTDMQKMVQTAAARMHKRIDACYAELKHDKEIEYMHRSTEHKHKIEGVYTALEHLYRLYFVVTAEEKWTEWE